MYGKTLFFIVLVVMGAIVPYLLTDDQWLSKVEGLLEKPTAAAKSDPSQSANKVTSAGKPITALTTKDVAVSLGQGVPGVHDNLGSGTINSLPPRAMELPRLAGPPGIPLANLLSFDIRPEWITNNWARVTTGVASLNLNGWRVPIALDEGSQLFGSITYYFDTQRQVQRIVVHGYTQNASQLVNLATSRYQMQQVPSGVHDLYVAVVDGKPIGAMRVKYTGIMRHNMAKRCEVLLELNRKATHYGMSVEFSRIIERARMRHELLRPIIESRS